MEKAITEKQTTRTGKRIGLKSRARVSISFNDERREASYLLEVVKKYYSGQKITAAEAYRIVIMRGLACVLEDIMLKQNAIVRKEQDRTQGRLFND